MEDLTGKVFNYWTVLEDANCSNSDGHLWKCKCKCGTIKNVSGRSLKTGRSKSCGCIKKEINKGKDITNQRFGKLIALEPTEKRSCGSIVWKCKCDCGNICERSITSLKRKGVHSCGCANKEQVSKLNKKDLTGQKFGLLTVLEETSQRDSGGCIIWKCKCDCQNICYVPTNSLTSNNTTSCGCLTISVGERNIKEILEKNNIPFIMQYQIPTSKKKRFDFAILDNTNNKVVRLIEFDGQQHFNSFKGMWNNSESLEEIQNRDNEKNLWAFQNNIPLVRIPYWHRDTITLEKIMGDQFLIAEE